MAADPDWFENDELFARELATGVLWQEAVAAVLRAYGVGAVAAGYELRGSVEEAHRFAQTVDVRVGDITVEVKSRSFSFSHPGDYPFPTAIVDTVGGWEAKASKPTAIVLVSQPTASMVVVPRSTEASWGRLRCHDRARNIDVENYVVRRELLRSMGALAEFLQTLNGG